MGFIEVFVKRPAIAIAICIIVLIAGIAAYLSLPVRQFPVFPPQKILIATSYPGASPSVIQGFVTIPIEEAISDIKGIDFINASNIQGNSYVIVNLKSNADLTQVLTRINTSVNSIRWRLPKDINDPVVSSSDSGSPSIFLSVTTDKGISLEQATAYVKHNVIPALRAIKGVADLRIRGEREYAMRIYLDPLKMAAQGISSKMVRDALAAQHLQAAVGKINNHQLQYNLAFNSSLNSAQQFNEIVVAQKNNRFIRLKDIGHAELGASNTDSTVLVNGKPGIMLYIKSHIDANDIATVKTILSKLPSIQAKLPTGMHLKVLWNPTRFSEKSIHEVKKTIWEAIILIIIITCLFLGDFKAMLIPIVTIPLSLLATIAIFYIIGFTINTMTLLAAVLAIGLVVDDAIVVLENVHRHILNKTEPIKAAIDGTKELLLPIIAMTIVVAIVFIPIGLTSGITGILFREFAFSLSITVVMSGIFSLIVSPMMCAYMLKSKEGSFAQWVNRHFDRFAAGYQRCLQFSINWRYAVIAIMILLFILCYSFFRVIPSELMPQENQGVVLGVGSSASMTNNRYLENTATQLGNIYQNVKDQAQYGVITGDSPPLNNIVSFLILKDGADENAAIKELQQKFKKIPGMMLYPMNRPLLADVVGLTAPVNFVLQSSGSYKDLNHVMQKLITEIKKNPVFENVSTDLQINKPQIDITLKRDLGQSLGISPQQIASAFNLFYAQPTVAWFAIDGFSYPVITQIANPYQQTAQKIKAIHIEGGNGNMTSLATLVNLGHSVTPLALNDFQLLHSATLTASLAPGHTLGEALTILQQTADRLLPSNMRYDYAGESRLYQQSHGEVYFIYLTSLICIYLLLVIKFNSFVDPITIMLSVPLSMIGALLAIYWLGFTLNIYTQIGLVMLIGLISKHGILIVDFANHLQKEKQLDSKEAVIAAAKTRLRPIVMTTAAMVLGAIPLAFARGAGHESLQQIGWVIVGGLFLGSILTLFVLPSVYTFLAKRFVK